MRIKNPTIAVENHNPFINDILNREESAIILTQLIETVMEPFVLAIDSGWGTGKTTFIKMWCTFLKHKGFHCLNFNAWENDFSDDPLISFIGEMQASLDKKTFNTEAIEYFEKVKKIGSSLVKRALPLVIKLGTVGTLDLNSFTEEAIADFTAKIAQEKIDRYEAEKQTIENFKKTLETFIAKLTKSEAHNRKPLVFFIDELDRCRPTYAIELLERVKHLFSIKGIVFILALDKGQITHSVKALYGSGMDAEGYLRRFIDLDYQLPEASTEVFCKYLFKTFGFDEILNLRGSNRYEKEHLLKTFIGLSKVFNFSLRVQEQCFTRFGLVLRTTPADSPLYPFLLATLIALKAANVALYREYISTKCSYKSILDYIRKTSLGDNFLNDNYGTIVEAYIVSAPCKQRELESLIQRYIDTAKTTGLPEPEKERAKLIADTLRNFIDQTDEYNILAYVTNKIEISERFVT